MVTPLNKNVYTVAFGWIGLECITLNNVSLIKGESLLDTMKSLESQNTSVIRDNERPTILFQMISTLKFDATVTWFSVVPS